jgi:hypothetical protein
VRKTFGLKLRCGHALVYRRFMPLMLRCAGFGRAAKAVTAVVATALVLMMMCFAASASLHQHLTETGIALIISARYSRSRKRLFPRQHPFPL